MFQIIAALWCTAIFFIWVLACAEDKRKFGIVYWTANTFGAVLLAGVPVGVLKFFVYLFS